MKGGAPPPFSSAIDELSSPFTRRARRHRARKRRPPQDTTAFDWPLTLRDAWPGRSISAGEGGCWRFGYCRAGRVGVRNERKQGIAAMAGFCGRKERRERVCEPSVRAVPMGGREREM